MKVSVDIFQLGKTIDRLQNRLNVSLSMRNFTVNFLCAGRNDLEEFFQEKPQSRSSSLVTLNWKLLAILLMNSNESKMCKQTYVTGSGTLMQTVSVIRPCRCVILDSFMRSNRFLNTFSTLLRPLLYGKIYYFPSNRQYDALIKQMNETFESLDALTRFLRRIQPFLINTSRILNEFFPEFTQHETSITLTIILTEFLACSERNRFVPMQSETAMIRQGQNQSVTNSFLAAIRFLDEISPNKTLPKHVHYKIRMNLDYVDNTFRTEDR